MGFINLPRRAKEMILWREPVETLPDPLPPCELCLGTDYRRPYKDRWSGMIFSRLKTTARRGCPSCCIVDQALQRVDDIWRDWLEQEQGKRRYIPHRADPKWNDEKMRLEKAYTDGRADVLYEDGSI